MTERGLQGRSSSVGTSGSRGISTANTFMTNFIYEQIPKAMVVGDYSKKQFDCSAENFEEREVELYTGEKQTGTGIGWAFASNQRSEAKSHNLFPCY